MFVLKPNPTFEAPVSFSTPTGEAKFTVEFRHFGLKESAKLDEEARSKGDEAATFRLHKMVVGWKDVDAPFSKENLDFLFDQYPIAIGAFFDAYYTAMGVGKVSGQAEKNS